MMKTTRSWPTTSGTGRAGAPAQDFHGVAGRHKPRISGRRADKATGFMGSLLQVAGGVGRRAGLARRRRRFDALGCAGVAVQRQPKGVVLGVDVQPDDLDGAPGRA